MPQGYDAGIHPNAEAAEGRAGLYPHRADRLPGPSLQGLRPGSGPAPVALPVASVPPGV